MCGIIGITGNTEVQDHIIDSLKRLEYRGYDSSGIATVFEDKLVVEKAEGKLKNLNEKLKRKSTKGNIGIGHTRWATHGNVSEVNAHPHVSGRVAIVHNGIIENYIEIKDQLIKNGREFISSTDSEVIAHLFDIELTNEDSIKQATINVLKKLNGAFAFVVLMLDNPNTLIAARQASPLALGVGDNVCAVGSDGLALSGVAEKLLFLEDGDFAILNNKEFSIHDSDGKPVERSLLQNSIDSSIIGKGNYRHFMQKEIFEQPETISHSLSTMYSSEGILSSELSWITSNIPNSITILAAGTSNYAGMIAKYWIEEMSEIPVHVESASEYRYRSPYQDPKGLAIIISQSGESIDTLMAMRLASEAGMKTLAIVNNEGSTIDRESDFSIYLRAGAEIAVASTKAFSSQLIVLLCLSIAISEKKNSFNELQDLKNTLFKIPGAIAKSLTTENDILEVIQELSKARSCLYLGRGPLYPLALEGALKLKEISYIHAEGFSAGEMKHGPIALIEEGLPVIAILAKDHHSLKTISNLREALARGARIIIIADEELDIDLDFAEKIIKIPHLHPILTPIIASIPIQLLAYLTAVSKGTDVDQPKNLAKSVTVE